MSIPPIPNRAYRAGRAVADDGLGIVWHAYGEGPAMVCCNGVGVSTFFWKYVVHQFSDRYTVVVWDYRAHGESDPLPDPRRGDVSIERHTQDLLAVLDDAALPDAALLGHSMGCQIIFEACRQFPTRVRGLVAILGTAGRTLETFFDNPRSPRYFRFAQRVIERLDERTHTLLRPMLNSPVAWPVARALKMVDPYYASAEDMLPYIQHLATLDMRMFIRVVLASNDHDAWEVLPNLRVPVLVVAAERDTFTPIRLSRQMARMIPGAELLVLAEASHAAIIEQPETINHRIERWLREHPVFPSA